MTDWYSEMTSGQQAAPEQAGGVDWYNEMTAPEPAAQQPDVPRETPKSGGMADKVAAKIGPDKMARLTAALSGNMLPTLERGTMGDAITEPLYSMAANTAGMAAGGAAGSYYQLKGEPEKADAAIAQIQQSFAEAGMPETEIGQASLETVGKLAEYGIDILRFPISGLAGLAELVTLQGPEQAAQTVKAVQDKGFEAIGNRVMEVTGSPAAATAARVAPEAIAGGFGVRQIARTTPERAVAQRIAAGETSKELAPYRLSEQSSTGVIKDPTFKPLKRMKFDEGNLQVYKASSPATQDKLLEMTRIKRDGLKDPLYRMDNRAADVVGRSLEERIKYVNDVRKQAGERLDDIVENLDTKTVNFDAPINQFIKDLEKIGVKLNDDLSLNFDGSRIRGLDAPQKALERVVDYLKYGEPGRMPTAKDLHNAKKYLDENLTFGKNAEGLGGKVEGILKNLRRNIDDSLDIQISEYNEANTAYSDAVNALNDLQEVAGKKMDLYGPNTDKALGTLSRRWMSNAQSRINLVDSVNQLDRVAAKHGAEFVDDIRPQILYANELDKIFGVSADTSLAGEVTKGVVDAAGRSGVIDKAANLAQKGAERIMTPSEEKAFRMLEEMLSRRESPWNK